MGYVATRDGTETLYKDWGPHDAQVIFFHHGWPLSADDWDAQMLSFLDHGYRVVIHDRREHGCSSQVWDGHDMDHYTGDITTVVDHLGVQGAVHIGYSTGGDEVIYYITYHGEDRMSKVTIINAVPPLMVQAANSPDGLPKSVFDGLQNQLKANHVQLYYDVPAGPFYGCNRPDARLSEGIVWNRWRQGMMDCTRAHYDGIVTFSQTDFAEDLKSTKIPALVMHGDDDQIVPCENAGVLSTRLL